MMSCAFSACWLGAPPRGCIVEIGSFKGKSTVMLSKIVQRYGHGPVVAIDPHGGMSYIGTHVPDQDPTFDDFLGSLRSSEVEPFVEVHRALSRDVGKHWDRPIRLLWIDGDHSYAGCKEDFDLFSPFLADGGFIAFHDSLNAFPGPIRVFVEEILRSDHFGASGFVHSIAWSQFRPNDGALFRKQRNQLERRAARLLPLVANGAELTGLLKMHYKLTRSRVPRTLPTLPAWLASLSPPGTR